MVQKRQNDQTRLLLNDAKFVPSKMCVVCGLPTRTASVKCLRCLEAQYLTEELDYTREWLRGHPGALIELGHDKNKLVHLVLLRASVRNLGWCGTKVTQVKAKRVQARYVDGKFLLISAPPPTPPTPAICVQCLAVYERLII